MTKKRIRRTDAYFNQEVFDSTNGEYVSTSPFVKMKAKVSMLHKTCGNEWMVTPNDFIDKDSRCPRCANEARTGRPKGYVGEYSQRVAEISNGEYVVQGEYVTNATKIPMMHTVCGNTWEVTPNNFINHGNRCPNCVVKGRTRRTTEEFKATVYDLVGDDYTVEGEYVHSQTPIPMLHTVCGNVYDVNPNNFLRGDRCPNCVYSRGEKAVAGALDALSIDYIREHSFESLGRKRFDFYIPSLHAAIEYDGEQHFEAIEYWGGQEALERTQKSDSLKNDFCASNSIHLLRIPYWDFDRVDEIVSDFINELMGVVP